MIVDAVIAARRREMVDRHIRARGVTDRLVLRAMEEVPRHLFVPVELVQSAYDDRPLSIGSAQTISQPYVVALMTEALGLSGVETVLEVGTGSGYQAAVLSRLCAVVHSVERIPELAERARENLSRIGVANVTVHVGDGTLGWPDAAPYDAILVTAGGPFVPPPLVDQLCDGGVLVAPVGDRWSQRLVRHRKSGERHTEETLGSVVFVPLVGRYGWEETGPSTGESDRRGGTP